MLAAYSTDNKENCMLRFLIIAGAALAAGQVHAAGNLSLALLQKCEGSKPETAAVGAILGKVVVGTVVDWAGAMIKAQAEVRHESLGTSSTEGRFFTLGSDGSVKRSYGCLRLISWSQTAEGPRTANALAALAHVNLYPADQALKRVPDFAAEFQITGPQDVSGVFALRPSFVYFGRSNISAWTNNKRSLALTFTFKDPSDASKAFASANFRFEQIPTDTLITRAANPLLYEQSSGWMSAPPFSPAETEAVESAALRLASGLANKESRRMGKELKLELAAPLPLVEPLVLAALGDYCRALPGEAGGKQAELQCKPGQFESQVKVAMLKSRLARARAAYMEPPLPLQELQPAEAGLMTVEAMVTETRDPSAFWGAVSGAFDANKDDLAIAVRQKLISSERRAADQAAREAAIGAANARDEARSAFEDAKLVVVEKEELLKQLSDKSSPLEVASAHAALVKARLKANSAARSSGQALPYPGLDA
jgi:hypothetical protein